MIFLASIFFSIFIGSGKFEGSTARGYVMQARPPFVHSRDLPYIIPSVARSVLGDIRRLTALAVFGIYVSPAWILGPKNFWPHFIRKPTPDSRLLFKSQGIT